MKGFFSKFWNKLLFHFNHRLFLKQWVIGFTKGDIGDIIRNKKFEPVIKWLPPQDHTSFDADPFFISSGEGTVSLLIENYRKKDHYGKLAIMTLDRDFRIIEKKIVLDTGSHLSYPYMYEENGNLYVFPESSAGGDLNCYVFDWQTRELKLQKKIIDLPLLDSNIFKHGNRYWIMGALKEKGREAYTLHLFYADQLMGPYQPHKKNPVKRGLDGVRGAGNIIKVDGNLYRPTQNCEQEYGKEITINRIFTLNEEEYECGYYMTISIDGKRNPGMKTIHTINVMNDLIVVDGMKWTFSPFKQNRVVVNDNRYFRTMAGTKKAGS